MKHLLGRDLHPPARPAGLGSAGADAGSWDSDRQHGGGVGAAGSRGGQGAATGTGLEPSSPLAWRPAAALGDV